MTSFVTILTERFADWECALTMAAARAYYGFDMRVATPAAKPVTSAGGLRVQPDIAIENIDPDDLDVLLICGGQTWEGEDAPDISTLLKALDARGKTIGAICAATIAPARAGLLNGIPHTSNAAEFLESAPAYKGGAHYCNVPRAVTGGHIVTAPGTAPVSFMKEIMQLAGKDRSELEFYAGMHAAEHAAA